MTDLPPAAPSPPGPTRVLRRSRNGRVAAGVASGLGNYFGYDPVLFRVLFATSAFFGGAGIIAYLIAWAAIPEEGTEHAAIDNWVGALRRRRIPVWLVASVAAFLLWLAAFSWWAPGPFLPVLVVVVVLLIAFGRRGTPAAPTATPPAPPTPPPTQGVDLRKPIPTVSAAAPTPSWVGDLHSWVDEARAASRARRRRALPVRLAVLGLLAVVLITLATIDTITGIRMPSYGWATLGIVGGGLLLGLALRRTPWGLSWLLLPALVWTIAFGNTTASLHDGIGVTTWHPTDRAATDYRLAIGRGTLDLRQLTPGDSPQTIRVTMGAGQVKVIAPRTTNITVRAHVRAGEIRLAGADERDGFDVTRTSRPPAGAAGAPVTVVISLASGNVTVDRP